MTTSIHSPEVTPRVLGTHAGAGRGGHPRSRVLLPAVAAFAWAIGAAAAGAQVKSGASVQTEAGSPALRARCSAAAAVLLSDTAATAPDWVYGTLGSCEVSGPDAIAHAWTVVRGDDPRRLNALVASSRAIRDQRIFRAVSDVLDAQRQDEPVLLAAINTLVGYAVPDAAGNPLGDVPTPHVALGPIGPTPVDGAQPLGDNVLMGVRFQLGAIGGVGSRGGWSTFLRRGNPSPARSRGRAPSPSTPKVSRSTPRADLGAPSSAASAAVVARAALAARALDAVSESANNTPGPDAVTLTAVCGTQFALQNRTSRPLRLQYVVDGSDAPAGEIGVSSFDHVVFTTPATDVVQLTYYGQVIATARSTGQACP